MSRKTLVLNTLDADVCDRYTDSIPVAAMGDVEVFNTEKMNIGHCRGCNFCLLKTPGVCSIKDDYEQILSRLAHTRNLWLIADTRFGFLNYKGKKVMDRILPMLLINLTFKEGEMRHMLRYDTKLNIGVVYCGDGNEKLLNEWCQRASLNLGGHSLGALPIDKMEEMARCM